MTVLLLDAHNLLFRSFASLPRSITDRSGQPINALYGMLAAVIRLWGQFQPAHMVAAFDVPDTPTFRHELYPLYQGQRGPLGGEHADAFRRQTELAIEALPRLGVPALTCPGYEADDIMGSLARGLGQRGGEAVLVSTDRDLLQLVGPGVEVLSPGSSPIHIRDAEGVRARLGVVPGGVASFKALAGDPSDNIPGVRGIGPKTAASLVNQYGDLEGVYAHLDEIAARTVRALEQERGDAFLFRQLATIVTTLDVPLHMDDLPRPEIDENTRAGRLLAQLGYRE